MKIKIENQNLRFKISENELNLLLVGEAVLATVVFLDKRLIVTIDPNGNKETMETELIPDKNEVHLNLLVPPDNIKTLYAMKQNREGLRQEFNGMSVILQIDMKDACHT